jgi:hypothetical protein
VVLLAWRGLHPGQAPPRRLLPLLPLLQLLLCLDLQLVLLLLLLVPQLLEAGHYNRAAL